MSHGTRPRGAKPAARVLAAVLGLTALSLSACTSTPHADPDAVPVVTSPQTSGTPAGDPATDLPDERTPAELLAAVTSNAGLLRDAASDAGVLAESLRADGTEPAALAGLEEAIADCARLAEESTALPSSASAQEVADLVAAQEAALEQIARAADVALAHQTS